VLIKRDPSYEVIGEVILKINIGEAEKIKAEIDINQDKYLRGGGLGARQPPPQFSQKYSLVRQFVQSRAIFLCTD
jgi:hypothetical protein